VAGSNVFLAAVDGRRHEVLVEDWRKAVCRFCDAVQTFYAVSSPKVFYDELDTSGFKKFWEEWSRRSSFACGPPAKGR
jgi:hypothetical protein